MNPHGAMRGQALCLLAATVFVCLTSVAWAGVAVVLLLSAWWTFLNSWYARALDARGRSDERIAGDREVAVQTAMVVLATLAVVTAASLGNTLELDPLFAVGAVCAQTFCAALYASSLIDWYYIRSQRDGVVRAPSCISSGEEVWRTVTRHWYRHRCLVIVFCYLLAVAGLAGLALGVLDEYVALGASEAVAAVVGSAAAAAAALQLTNGSLSKVGPVFASCSVNPPDHAIGQALTVAQPRTRYFVQEVAVEGVVLVPISKKHLRRDQGQLQPAVMEVQGNLGIAREIFTGCGDGCCGVNRDCSWVPERAGDGRPRRFVV